MCVRDQNTESSQRKEKCLAFRILDKELKKRWENTPKDYAVYVYDFVVSVLLNLMM